MHAAPDDPKTSLREEREEAEYVAALVAAAPPLSKEKREQIVNLLARPRRSRTGAA